jgi:REP element-mobilizing transposase RayT
MSRRKRPHLPGAIFHLTARLQGRDPLFTPGLRTALVRLLRHQVAFADLQLFAYAIMPNHLHLVVRQGGAPLYRFMQPFLCRAALLIQRRYGREGHVFERRYRDHLCGDPEHIRNAIIYTHLNPVRAKLCGKPEEYAWSSHGAWLGNPLAIDGRPHPVTLALAAQLFATAPDRDSTDLAKDYRAFLRWRHEQDLARAGFAAGEVPKHVMPRPTVGYGNEDWVAYLSPRGERYRDHEGTIDSESIGGQAPRPDLETIARAVTGKKGERPDLDLVRSRWGGTPFVRARHEIIRRAAAAGYRGVDIAAYLRISPKTVSATLMSERRKLLTHPDTCNGQADTTNGQL